MSSPSKGVRLQIDASPELRDRAKALAYEKGMTLNEMVLLAIASYTNDKAMKKLVETELESRSRGRPWPKK